jgi:hypothetical protein
MYLACLSVAVFFVLHAVRPFNSPLFAKLKDSGTTNQATQEIIQAAAADPALRQHTERLPAVIDSQQPTLIQSASRIIF